MCVEGRGRGVVGGGSGTIVFTRGRGGRRKEEEEGTVGSRNNAKPIDWYLWGGGLCGLQLTAAQ